MKKIFLFIATWTLAVASVSAQLHNQGAQIVIQSGVIVKTDLAVQNSNGGILNNEGTLVTSQSLNNATTAVLNGNGAVFVGSDWSNSATFTPGNTAVTFDENTPGLISPGGHAFNGVTLNKSANRYCYLGAPMTINGALTFQAANNYLALGAHNLTVNTVAGAASDRFIVTNGTGLATKNLTGTTFTFPVGYGTGFDGSTATPARYAPVTLTTPFSVTDQQFQAGYYRINPGAASFPTGGPFPSASLAGLCGVSTTEYWDVNGAVPAQMTLTWDATSNISAFLNNLSDLRVAGWNGSQWVNLGQAAITGDLTAGSITSSLLTSNNYSAYTLAGVGPLPTIACPAAIVKTTDLNQCSTAVTYAAVSSTSICSSATPTRLSGLPSGSAFPVGVNVVTWQATNTVGSMTCSFTVTVNDGQNPSIVCPANMTRTTALNQCSAAVTYANPSFSDNCTGASILRTGGQASGTSFPKGVNMVNWKATDAAGNSSVCGFTVTVTDGQVPTITCPSNQTKTTGANLCTAVATYTTPAFSDNCTGAAVSLQSGLTSGSIFQKGTNTIIWRATDGAGLTVICAFTVTVTDGQQPAIICPANQTKSTDPGQCTAVTTYTTPTFSDNCTGGSAALFTGLASGSSFPKGLTTVVWKATDAVGLTQTCSFRITVNDTQAPAIACPSNQAKTTDSNLCTAVATYAIATFTDNCTGASVVKLSGLNSGSAFPKGVSSVVFKATDAAGNQSLCTMTVTVTDPQVPGITCPSNISVTGTVSSGICSATVTYSNPAATDNCGILSNFLLSGLASGSVFPQGVTTNVWKATDNGGLTATCAFTVAVGCGTGAGREELAGRSEQGGVGREELEVPGTENQQRITMHLTPNPATTQVQITLSGSDGQGGVLMVYDANGRLVWRHILVPGEQTAVLEVDRAEFASGTYQVCLRTETGQVTQTLAVTKL